MIEPIEEMRQAYADVSDEFDDPDERMEARLRAWLAIVERDRCMQQRGHDRPKEWPEGVGGKHPHHCVSCSREGKPGPGCINCRSTGYDQTPWPQCPECRS